MKSDVLAELESPKECNHFANGRCDSFACVRRLEANSPLIHTVAFEFVGCDRYRAAAAIRRLRARVAELEPNAARYLWLRDCNTGPAKIASADIVSDDRNPPYWELKCGDDLDAAIDAARRADGDATNGEAK